MFSSTAIDINPAYLGNRMKRFLAFCIDIFPIYFIVIIIYRQFSDYDTLMEPLLADPYNLELQEAIQPMMNTIGMIGGITYLIYCFLMEASLYQATFGKKLMQLKVITNDGETLSIKEAFWRNAFKVFSNALFNIGFFWILFDKQNRGWHDIMGKTFVVDTDYESDIDIPDELFKQLEEIKDQPYQNTASTLSGSNFNTLKEGNQSNLLYYPDLELNDFELIKSNNPNPINRLSKYQSQLIDPILAKNADIPGDLVWNNNTRGQKLMRIFNAFDNHIKSDGLYAFLFHNSEFTFAMIEVLKEIGADRILPDYMQVVGEFGEQMEVFTEHRKTFEFPLTSDKEKKAAYRTAKATVSSVSTIEQYYSDDAFQKDFYQKVCNYIESNPHMFVQVNS